MNTTQPMPGHRDRVRMGATCIPVQSPSYQSWCSRPDNGWFGVKLLLRLLKHRNNCVVVTVWVFINFPIKAVSMQSQQVSFMQLLKAPLSKETVCPWHNYEDGLTGRKYFMAGWRKIGVRSALSPVEAWILEVGGPRPCTEAPPSTWVLWLVGAGSFPWVYLRQNLQAFKAQAVITTRQSLGNAVTNTLDLFPCAIHKIRPTDSWHLEQDCKWSLISDVSKCFKDGPMAQTTVSLWPPWVAPLRSPWRSTGQRRLPF